MSKITHNLSAMNAQRYLGITASSKKKSSEKLSSGYKINRSADDAAGLTISEKMRIQIRGLNKASHNVQDGMSLLQTADGALGEVHDILQRMNEIATQAANDTNAAADRGAIQSELNQLKNDINRISKTTQFNSQNILEAKQLVLIDADDYYAVTMDDRFYGFGTSRPSSRPVYGKNLDFSNVNNNNKEQMIGKQFFVTCSQNCSQIFSFIFTDDQQSTIDLRGINLTVKIGVKDNAITNGNDIAGKIFDLVTSKQAEFTSVLQGLVGWQNIYGDTVIGHANALNRDGANLTFYSINDGPPYAPGMGLIYATDLLELEQNFLLQVSEEPYEEIALNMRTINSATLGVGRPDVRTFETAGKTMNNIQTAIDNLSEYRSYLGAMQNRLEKTRAVVDTTSENTQNAESRLRDTEMAEETIHYSRSKILEQFGQSILSQASQSKESVLQLLA